MKALLRAAIFALGILAISASIAFGQDKTREQFVADLKAGEYVSGTYDMGDTPYVMWDTPNVIGHPVKGAKLVWRSGPGLIAGWAVPKPPPELWTADGGLRLRDNAGENWRITIPTGRMSHPGKAPDFWATTKKVEWALEFSLANYIPPSGTPYPIFGIRDEVDGPSPIMVLAGGKRLTVYVRDSVGTKTFQASVLDDKPAARNKIRIVIEGNKVTIAGPIGSYEFAIVGPIADNSDNAFQIGSGASTMTGDGIWQPGDLTFYGLTFTQSPSQFIASQAMSLKIPAKGEWYLGLGAFLTNPNRKTDSWSTPTMKIENVEILAAPQLNDGASISLGYSGHNVVMRDIRTWYHQVGIQSFSGPSYKHTVENWRAEGHSVAAYVSRNAMIKMSHVLFNRAGRDDCLVRGGKLQVDYAMIVPGGNNATNWRLTSFRFLPWYDPMSATLSNITFDDEGSRPRLAQVYADCRRSRFGTENSIVLRDCVFVDGDIIANLVGAPSVQGAMGYFKLDNCVSMVYNPIVLSTPAWNVEGETRKRPAPVTNPAK